MADSASTAPGAFVAANGIETHYWEAGSGPALILLHGGSASNDPVWEPFGWGWSAYAEQLASDFRVLAPDLRGHGWTHNPSGPVSYDLLAEDLAAFITALGLERPAVIGFSDGGVLAGVLTIREPDMLSAHVNIAGYDLFDPAAPSMENLRRTLSANDPDARRPDLDHLEAQARGARS